MPYHTIRYNTIQYDAMYTTQYNTTDPQHQLKYTIHTIVQRNATKHNATPYDTTKQYNAIPYAAIQEHARQHTKLKNATHAHTA
jgi:hypothetical protein